MAYLGAQPNQTLTKTTSQSFNGTGSATVFTLNRAVNTGEELEVFVENVQQEPGSGRSYTASGTTLTFDEAPPSGTGNIYVIYRGQAEVTTRLEHDANAALAATTGTFTQLNSDNLRLDGNTISSTDTNGDITLDPNGTGAVVANSKIQFGSDAQTNITGGGASDVDLILSGDTNIRFETNTNERLRITTAGDVGIGTSSPSVTGLGLEIHNSGNDTLGSIRLAGNNNTGTPGQKFNTELRHNGGSGQFQILHYGSGNSVGTERFRIDAGGDSYTNDGTISSLSDSRVKKEVADLQDGLTIVNQLRPVTFKYNGAASMAPDEDRVNYGFIADEVQAVAPHYVTESTDEINGVTVTDFKSLSTGRMLPMLFKAVQELSTKVETLEARLTALEGN